MVYQRKRINILGMQTDVISIPEAASHITEELIPNLHKTGGKYICASNVHMCMECYDDAGYKKIVNNAALVLPDGRPIYWTQKLLGAKRAEHVRGFDISMALFQKAEELQIPIGFYGATERHMDKITQILAKQFPKLLVNCTITPPFRELSAQEKQNYVNEINTSGTKILFVALGCPKQERWMAEHKGKLNCVSIGVGAVFDFLAGEKKQAPYIFQKTGMEWAFRFASEPKRLWKRYLKLNPKFLWLLTTNQFRKQKTIKYQN